MDAFTFTAPPTPPTTQDPTNFDPRADALVDWLVTMTSEHSSFAVVLAALVPQLALAASPGGIVLTYTFDGASATVADPGNGKLRFNNLTQASATALLADNADNLGVLATPRLALLTSTSTIKGSVFIYKATDPSRWMLGQASANTAASGYYNITVGSVQVSTANPFTDGDDLVMILVPKGDKGDTGATGPASGWVLDSTTPVSGSPAAITLALPLGYSDIKIELDGLVPSTATSLSLAASANGVTFSSFPLTIRGGSNSLFVGCIELIGYRHELTHVLAAIGSSAISSPEGTVSTSEPAGLFRTTGGMSHARLGLGAGNFTNVGNVRVYRRG